MPNGSARQLKAGRSPIVAYVVLDAGNPFFTDVARGVEETIRSHGLSLFLCDSDQDPSARTNTCATSPSSEPAGCLITPADPGTPNLLEAWESRGLRRSVLDAPRQWCAVGVDDVEGGDLAVEHLVERGHRRIGFIGGPTRSRRSQTATGGARAIERRARC